MAHTPAHLDSSITFQRKNGSGLRAALSMLATVMLCQAGFTHAINQDWPFLALVPNSNLLLVAGETIDTTSAPSLLQQGTRREAYFNATFAQYYVQLKNDADVSKLHEAIGGGFKAYVPNNAYIVLASGGTALEIAALDFVHWVGKRPDHHKVSISQKEIEAILRRKVRGRTSAATSTASSDHTNKTREEMMEEWERKNLISLHVTVHTQAEWDSVQHQMDKSGADSGVNRNAGAFALRCFEALSVLGVGVLDTYRASDQKVVVRVKPEALRDTLEWLSEQPEALWVEEKRKYYPLMSHAKKLIIDGPSDSSLTSQSTLADNLRLDGKGQIIAVADTGLDWDSCFFWQSRGHNIFVRRGSAPPFNTLDLKRRKLVSYNFNTDCKVCDVCPVDIYEDQEIFTATNGMLESRKSIKLFFPNEKNVGSASIPPRNYNSAGASVKFNIESVTTDVPSEYLAQGAGAFDIGSIDIQIFILPRAAAKTFDANNPDFSKCLNNCRKNQGPSIKEDSVVLDASNGGYGIIIANRGFTRPDTKEVINAHVLLKGKIQFKTAPKPCGDAGDDRAGHGTHTASVAAGAADTPPVSIPEFAAKRPAAAVHNGIAPGAQIHFTDVMQNASPDCNIPGKICPRVGSMTIPLDLGKDLFLASYEAGARIHLNSWGCRINKGERTGLCNKYTTRSRDVDAFMYDHPDFLIIFAAGENGQLDNAGSISEPGTCKNCLTVGSTHTWNLRYREAIKTRDPHADICSACSHPYYCSRSEFINGLPMFPGDYPISYNNPNLNGILGQVGQLKTLADCCNDTVHEYHHVEDIVIGPQQWYTVHLPNMSYLNPDIMAHIRNKFGWARKGATIAYDFKATIAGVSSTSALEDKPGIQVFLLTREDFTDYFELGIEDRPNPCVTTAEAQTLGTEKCMSQEKGVFTKVQNCRVTPYKFAPGRSFAEIDTDNDGCIQEKEFRIATGSDTEAFRFKYGLSVDDGKCSITEISEADFNSYTWDDSTCHEGQCKRYDEITEETRTKNLKPDGKWGSKIEDGCPLDEKTGQLFSPAKLCCNDKYLETVCLNQQLAEGSIPAKTCTEISNRLTGSVRIKQITLTVEKGFGVAVRNMLTDKSIKLTGTVEIRNKEYPCTLLECCGAPANKHSTPIPQSECCSTKYPRDFAGFQSCEQCGAVESPGQCHPNEIGNLPSWTARGPGQSDFLKNLGGKLFKPDLVAPGIQIVAAHSDGMVADQGDGKFLKMASVGEPEDLEVQCELGSQFLLKGATDFRCNAGKALPFVNNTAVRAMSGSSVSAALIAGSAALIRQYFADGYYPVGTKDVKNTIFQNPSASLVKAMLINSARPVGGSVDTYTYKYPAPCDPLEQVCSPWTKPTPDMCKTDPAYKDVDCYVRRERPGQIPNYLEGFGRPMLQNVLWTSDSTYSLVIDEAYVPQGYQRTYKFQTSKISPEYPLKITLAWTDPPGTPLANDILVNDIDLIIQLQKRAYMYNPNLGISTIVDVIEPYFGNDPSRTNVPDRSNVVVATSKSAYVLESGSDGRLIIRLCFLQEQVVVTSSEGGGNSETNVTVVVVGSRVPVGLISKSLGTSGQKFSLVLTGTLKLQYDTWLQCRPIILQFVEDYGRESKPCLLSLEICPEDDDMLLFSFNSLDSLKMGAVGIEDFKVNMKGKAGKLDEDQSRKLLEEADSNTDGSLNLEEWKAAVRSCRF